MYNKTMHTLGSNRSVIRELFEYGKQRAAEVGAYKVYDFSLGNPNVPAPECINKAIKEILDTECSTLVHGYTSAQGNQSTRSAIAKSLRKRFGVEMDENLIYMTAGAAASLTIALNAIVENDDEIILIAPYFPEYTVFSSAAGAKPVVVPFNEEDFSPNFEALEKAITKNTKGIIINSPNNPSGTVYSRETLERLCALLSKEERKYSHPIALIADEPYREIVYGDVEIPYLPSLYDNTIVCYSYSKSLSLPGERIGYIAVSPRFKEAQNVYTAICGAGRALGYVCAPSLFQKVVERCVDALPDIASYEKNRNLIYNALTELGYTCVRPDGAFYLFIKALEDDANAFANKAKALGLLIVPGDDFGAKGWVRLSYCISYDVIERSIPAFKELKTLYS